MKKLISAFVLILCFALLPKPAFAHELIRDSNMTSGMIFHIDPDDDPTPGKPSRLFFDLPSIPTDQKISATLSVSMDSKTSRVIPITIDGNSVNAEFTFPTARTYHFALVVVSNNKPAIYQFSVTPSGSATKTHTPRANSFAFTALVVSGLILAALVLVAILHRKSIAVRSQHR